MPGMRARIVLAAVLLAAIGGTALVHRLNADRQYRQLLAAGDETLAAGETYRAVEAFSGALALKPQSMVAYLRRGEAYRAQQRLDEAVRDWKEANRLAPEAPQPLTALGGLAEAQGDYRQAAEWYGQAVDRLKDEDPALLYRLALARYRSGAPGAALDPLVRAAGRSKSSADMHYLLGLLYRDTNNPARAIDALQLALTISPSLVAAREELADLYREQGRSVEEMAQLQWLARDGQSARRIAIGLAEARQGQLDAALGTLGDALDADPNDSRVLLAIGRVYLARAESGRAEARPRALAVLEQALGGTARRSEGLALYGRALFLSGKEAEAERILADAVATSPIATEAFGYLADAADRLGHTLIARDALVNLDVLEGDTAPAAARLARAQRIGTWSLELNDYKLAAQYLARVVAGQPDDAAATAQLAEARWRLGDTETARTLLAKALTLSPNDPRVQRLARTIR